MPSESKSGSRIDVKKTYKLYVGGAFPRSESGRSYVVNDSKGKFLANAAYASRKDARDAVQAARKAFGGWSARTPYNRGQVVYRIAEVLEGRRVQFVDEVQRGEGVTKRQAEVAVDASVDRLVWYAGWADKIAQVVGGTNPVAAPFFNFSLPEPTGVVAVVAPQGSSLLGLVSVVAPVIVSGNTVVSSVHARSRASSPVVPGGSTRFTVSAAARSRSTAMSSGAPARSSPSTSACAASHGPSSVTRPVRRLTTPPGTSEVASTSASSTAGNGRSADATTTAVQPVASTGASTSTSPVSAEPAGASTPITPVGTGVEKLTYGPATGLTDPSTVRR